MATQPFAQFDFESQQADIARKRQLAQAMMQQAMTPAQGQMVSGHYVGPGIGALQPLIGAILGTKFNQDADKASAGAASQYREGLGKELDSYEQTRNGTPGQVMSDEQASQLMQNGVQPQLSEPIQADPRKAARDALISAFPEMRSLGAQDYAEARKKSAGYKDHTVNNKIVRTYEDGRVQQLGDFETQDKWTDPYMMDGPQGKILVRKNLSTGKVESVIGSGQQINVNTGDNAALKGLIEANLPGGKGREPAVAAAQSLQLANEQLAAIAEGAKTGSLGNVQQELRKFGELIGVKDAATAPTEMLGSLAKQRVLAKLGGLGAQISNSDRDFLSSAQGDLTTNPEAFKRLLAISIAADLKVLNNHGKSVSALDGKIDEQLQGAMKVPFTVQLNDPEVGAMVDRVLAGKPSVLGATVQPKASTGPRKIASDDDYNALPSGTEFLDPNGQLRRKP